MYWLRYCNVLPVSLMGSVLPHTPRFPACCCVVRAVHCCLARYPQLLQPDDWQQATLGSSSMVDLPAQMFLPAYYVVGTGEVAKTVLAGEGDITTQGVDRDIRFGERR